jgi:hypothetical protein
LRVLLPDLLRAHRKYEGGQVENLIGLLVSVTGGLPMSVQTMDDKEKTISPGTTMSPCELCGLWEPMGGLHFMTRRELETLDRMRKLKSEVRALRQKPDPQLWSDPDKGAGRAREMSRLRTLWKELEAEKDAAREERMHLLGHASE